MPKQWPNFANRREFLRGGGKENTRLFWGGGELAQMTPTEESHETDEENKQTEEGRKGVKLRKREKANEFQRMVKKGKEKKKQKQNNRRRNYLRK